MYNGPQRKRLRLEKYDYSNDGFYFVTICTKNREEFFGEIVDGKMILNEFGKIAEDEILNTQIIRSEIEIDIFIIMPNHIHLLIIIKNNENVQTVRNAGLRSLQGNEYTKNKLSNAIQRIKSSTTKQIREKFNDFAFSWQKSFFDVIIKNEDQLNKTRQYIIDNPLKWEVDKNNPENIK